MRVIENHRYEFETPAGVISTPSIEVANWIAEALIDAERYRWARDRVAKGPERGDGVQVWELLTLDMNINAPAPSLFDLEIDVTRAEK